VEGVAGACIAGSPAAIARERGGEREVGRRSSLWELLGEVEGGGEGTGRNERLGRRQAEV
jgi:hypothetical protein